MTTLNHTPYATGGPLTAAAMEFPLGQLDAAIEAVEASLASVIVAGSATATTLTAQALLGQASLVVASSVGFLVGDLIYVGNETTFETRIVSAIPDATHITVSVNLTITQAIGKPVAKSPVELVEARGTFASLGARLAAIATRLYNVKEYGATGDGATDDTTAINAAITAATTAGGGIVFFPVGTYVIGSTLVIGKGVSIQGADRSTTIFLKNAANCTMLKFAAANEDGFYATLRQFVKDIRLDGNKANQGAGAWYGIQIEAAGVSVNTTMFLENVWIQFTKGSGYLVGNNRIGVVFVHCVAWGTANYGFELLSSDNQLLACSGGQNLINLYINNWSNFVIGGWWFSATGAAGIHLFTSARYNTISGAGVDMNAQVGILVEGEYNAITGNEFNDNSLSAADTYAHIQVSTPKLGNVVTDNVIAFKSIRALAGLKVAAGSPGIYGPNSVEPTAAISEAFSPVPVKMAVRPRATVHRNAVNQSIVNVTATAITFTTVREDTHGLWSAGAPTRFVIPANRGLSGRYRVTFRAQFATNATGVRQLRLLNAVEIVGLVAIPAVAASETIAEVSREIDLADGGFIEAQVYQSSGGALNVVATGMYGCDFSITRLED